MKFFLNYFGWILILIAGGVSASGQDTLPKRGTRQDQLNTRINDTLTKQDSTSCGSFEYGGQVYHTIIIGSQCWMKENLNLGKWLDQSQSQTQADNGIIEKYCYGNDFVQCDLWGGLYQWGEMMQYSRTSGAQGICPAGWHIPNSQDWKNLIRFLGGNDEAGGKLKSTGNRDWNVPNVGATNSSRFTAYPGGYFDYMAQAWGDEHEAAYFWSSETITNTTSVALTLIKHNSIAELYEEYIPSALSVRCVRDQALK
jgi:uncharacterized protein (TIGR02145 family)